MADIDSAIFQLVEDGTVLPSYFDNGFQPVSNLSAFSAWRHDRTTAAACQDQPQAVAAWSLPPVVFPPAGRSLAATRDLARMAPAQCYRSEPAHALKSTHFHPGQHTKASQDANTVRARSFTDLKHLNRMGQDYAHSCAQNAATRTEDMTVFRSNTLNAKNEHTKHERANPIPSLIITKKNGQTQPERAKIVKKEEAESETANIVKREEAQARDVSPFESSRSQRTTMHSQSTKKENPKTSSKPKGVGAKPQNARRNKKPVFWSPKEHEKFLEGLQKFNLRGSLGKGGADLLAMFLGTRSASQIKSHAQKHFAIAKGECFLG